MCTDQLDSIVRPLVTALWNSCELKLFLVSGILTWTRNTSLKLVLISSLTIFVQDSAKGRRKLFSPCISFRIAGQSFLKISSYPLRSLTHYMTMINVRSPGRPSLPTSSSEAGLTQRDYLAIGLCAGSHHHHHHHHPPSQHDHRQASWCCSTCSRWSCWS